MQRGPLIAAVAAAWAVAELMMYSRKLPRRSMSITIRSVTIDIPHLRQWLDKQEFTKWTLKDNAMSGIVVVDVQWCGPPRDTTDVLPPKIDVEIVRTTHGCKK